MNARTGLCWSAACAALAAARASWAVDIVSHKNTSTCEAIVVAISEYLEFGWCRKPPQQERRHQTDDDNDNGSNNVHKPNFSSINADLQMTNKPITANSHS